MNFGLTDEQYKLLDLLVIRPLKDRKAQVYIFGSRARGAHHPFSDIDILYKENPNFPIDISDISRIKEDIEESNLVVKVDLVNDLDLAASYRSSVERDKILV